MCRLAIACLQPIRAEKCQKSQVPAGIMAPKAHGPAGTWALALCSGMRWATDRAMNQPERRGQGGGSAPAGRRASRAPPPPSWKPQGNRREVAGKPQGSRMGATSASEASASVCLLPLHSTHVGARSAPACAREYPFV